MVFHGAKLVIIVIYVNYAVITLEPCGFRRATKQQKGNVPIFTDKLRRQNDPGSVCHLFLCTSNLIEWQNDLVEGFPAMSKKKTFTRVIDGTRWDI